DNFALGAFLNYHSNHEYFGRQTLPVGEGGSLNTDQQHTAFQLPFGLTSRYVWNRGGAFQPYAGVKLGAEYAQLKSTFNVFEANKNTWGFHVSPEIGFNVYPWAYGPGLHVAAYYSYSTNKGDLFTYNVDGLSNFGLRVGIAF
ncbi:outer membrane beta-barrel protein, partial [uncultured Bacteroides sp.]